ncbi:MAG: SH3 domain-containing protein [Candidatus Fimadaptatus sp.]
MARKWLSGVLAFTMVFGCTAPMALAEEAPVENVEEMGDVEQYAVYAPSLAKDTVYVSKDSEEVIAVNDVNPNADYNVEMDSAIESIVTVTFKDGKLTVKSNADISDPYTITVTFSKAAGQDDLYKNSVQLTVKPAAAAPTVNMEGTTDLSKADAKVGSSWEMKIVATDKGAAKAPDTVTVQLNDAAKKFFSYDVKDITDNDGNVVGKKVVFTADSVVTQDDADAAAGIGGFVAKVDASYGSVKMDTAKVYLPDIVKKNYDIAYTGLSMTANVSEVKVNESAQFAAKVMKSDGFGGNVTDDYADVNWYVNGNKVKFEGENATITDALGEEIATATRTEKNGKYYTDFTFIASKAGEYKIAVQTADESYMASKPLTVKDEALEADAELYIADAKDWSTGDAKGGIKVTTPGTSLDLSGIRFAGRDMNDSDITANGHPIADFGISVKSYKVLNAKVGGNVVAVEDIAKKAVSVDANGKVTVADENNTVMKELLAKADGKDIVFDIEVSFKDAAGKAYSLGSGVPVQVVVATPSEKADSIELYLDGKQVTDKSIVLNVGEKYDFDVKVKDAHGYTDAVDQRVVWQIKGNSDTKVCATVDQNGVVTPKLASIEDATLKVASIAGNGVTTEVKLIIVGEDVKPTAEPSVEPTTEPTAEPTTEPTAEPTAEPTTAPVQKGKVATSSSSLNVRETPDGEKIGSLKKGTIVTILGKDGDWLLVTDGDLTGYVAARYIEIIEDKPVDPETGVATVKTAGSALNMRQSPSTSAKVITKIANGSTVTVVEKGEKWTKVKYNGKTGYVSTQYLEFEEDAVG